MESYADKKAKNGNVNSNQESKTRADLNPVFQLKDNRPQTIVQKEQVENLSINKEAFGNILQKKENKTGLPDHLKSGIENLSGHSMDDVKVHYNSNKPAQLNAHAYAQGTQIHIATGQEKHLPHEAWHVVQQKQGRVKPTLQMKGKVHINDDKRLEKEADVMGATASALKYTPGSRNISHYATMSTNNPAQLTPAERLLAQHPPQPEDDMHALIGSDNDKGGDLVAPELQYCIDHHMTLPATLASHLKGRKWTADENTAWIEQMIKTGKVFVVLHTKILAALKRNAFPAAYSREFALKRDNIGATWKEVLTLMKSGYFFDHVAQVLLPPSIASIAYHEIMNKRITENAHH